jgi:hypothetical protein
MTKDELIEALQDDLRDVQIDTVKTLLRFHVQGIEAYKLAATIVDAIVPTVKKFEVEQEAKRLTVHND